MLSDSLPTGRHKLTTVLQSGQEIIRIDDVVQALKMDRVNASKLLSRWTQQGWLRRVSSGAYVAVPLDALDSQHVISDPWILVPALFSPAYVGGRTAAEHWDLTEQIFRDIVVMTGQNIRQTSQRVHGAHFTLRHTAESKFFGTRPVWRNHSKVLVSDIHKTIIDMLDVPSLGGGMQHVNDCLATYLKKEERDIAILMDYAEELGNGAVFKRLGYLSESLGSYPSITNACMENLTQGNAKLDPGLPADRLVSKWHLWVPSTWSTAISK